MTEFISAYLPHTLARDWGTEEIIAEGPGYCGKILRYNATMGGGLQLHRQRTESFYLVSGRGWVDFDGGNGTLSRLLLDPGMTIHVPAGAVHRFTAFTDCVVYEVSTSVEADRVRMERHYGEPETGGLPTTEPR